MATGAHSTHGPCAQNYQGLLPSKSRQGEGKQQARGSCIKFWAGAPARMLCRQAWTAIIPYRPTTAARCTCAKFSARCHSGRHVSINTERHRKSHSLPISTGREASFALPPNRALRAYWLDGPRPQQSRLGLLVYAPVSLVKPRNPARLVDQGSDTRPYHPLR